MALDRTNSGFKITPLMSCKIHFIGVGFDIPCGKSVDFKEFGVTNSAVAMREDLGHHIIRKYKRCRRLIPAIIFMKRNFT